MPAPLGRRPPSDWTHVDKYPLTAATAPAKPVPVVIGVNWYVEFDKPQKDSQGHSWIARDGKLTRIRGGHCVCLKPRGATDPDAWWTFYNQGSEGACVGFGISRLASQLNRKLYDGFWLYHEAKKVDEWPGDDYDGTSVRAGLDILRKRGHRVVENGRVLPESIHEGIVRNRWARSIDDILDTLGYSGLDYVDVLNSWGRNYPHLTRMPAKVLERLWKEDGEVGIVTDR
ncbi:MAG TPA: hypothetical protein VFZ00_05945 [Solirubrobacter sp.]|jgi:hypothetical protein|nr:hypothetical protein [Solirubrobacter sp.]